MATGYDRFVKIVDDNKFFTDATGAFRGVILSCTDCGTAGIAVNALGHDLYGEAFAFYVDENRKMRTVSPAIQERQRARFPNAFVIKSRNALDYVERKFAY